MNYEDRFSQKHIVLFSLLIGIIFVVVFGYFGTMFFSMIMPQILLSIPGINYFPPIFSNFIAFLFLILLIKKIDLYYDIPWNFNGVFKGLLLGSTLIIFTLLQMFLIFLNSPDKTIVISIIPMVNTIIFCISIGLWEETLCRGILLTNMLKKWGKTKKGIITSIIFSSLIFGGLHIITALNGNLINSLIQVVYASIMGMFLSTIYIKTKSLWSVIVLHIILNFSAYSMPFLMPFSVGINQVMFLLILLIFNTLWLILIYVMLYKIDSLDIEELLLFN